MQDLVNADCILIQGSDMAECHPVAFRFVTQARERGATVIHVDPRYTRTSALADLHVPIRAGSDIAFLGALVNYVLERDLWFPEYVRAYTNATFLLRPDFRDSEDLEGIFSGFDPEVPAYDPTTWRYQYDPQTGEPLRDDTLADPLCVLNVLRRHFHRYTPELVAQLTGASEESFLRVAELLTRNSGPDRTSALCYAVGWTQHTVGVQIIRTAAILQLLLGNIGRPGGGIMALRGHATIQGSTDIPTLYHLLPGYLRMPDARKHHPSLQEYIETEASPTGWSGDEAEPKRSGWWVHTPAYVVSLLKAWYGDAARRENDFCYELLPKVTQDHSQLPLTVAMKDGEIEGLLVLGQNPAVGGHNTSLVRRGLARLRWLVVRDFFETETACFWKDSPEVERGELLPEEIGTEVFLLPAATTPEKDGTYTNTQRLIQWHDRAVQPPGDARSESWFCHHLAHRLKDLYSGEEGPAAEQIGRLYWPYREDSFGEPAVDEVLREINGYHWSDRRQLRGFADLRDDGSTACGCWIYSGVYPDEGRNRARSREADSYVSPEWGFAWPANRRLMYNRASARPDGRPWSERKRYLWWEDAEGSWTGYDVPDFPHDRAPDAAADWRTGGMAALSGTDPFIMMPDGKGWLFAPQGLEDGPLPAHYEPLESPVGNLLYPRRQSNPVAVRWERPDNPYHAVGDPEFPHVLTTYRLTEHQTGGLMSRAVPWLAELQPELFCELGEELASAEGITSGDWVRLRTARGEIRARALVTGRLRPLEVAGRRVHQVGLPWHFGWRGLARGAVANDLSALAGDPNVTIHEGKVFTCSVTREQT